MKFAFLIFKYFPFGGMQRDMLRIAQTLAEAGQRVDIYTMTWNGDMPAAINVNLIGARGITNHKRYDDFIRNARQAVAREGYDLVVGFNKMPGLDAYFAADSCFIEKAHKDRSWLYRWSRRARWFTAAERAVFDQKSSCRILLLSAREKAVFQRWYGTADERFHVLPPYVSAERMALRDRDAMRQRIRAELGLREHSRILLMVGSGFRTKGLDRAISALAAMPHNMRSNSYLVVVGQDNPKGFQRMVRELGLTTHVFILPGRSDIPELMQGSDLLIHPARRELAGHVLIEAMASQLPVLVTDICGYAPHVRQADAGMLLSTPFRQDELNTSLAVMLASDRLQQWGANGLRYAQALMAANDGSAEAGILLALARERAQQQAAHAW